MNTKITCILVHLITKLLKQLMTQYFCVNRKYGPLENIEIIQRSPCPTIFYIYSVLIARF
jgi:hypothetical protein